MNDRHKDQEFGFTDSDRLLLLQLMTRRAMAERSTEAAESDDGVIRSAPDATLGDAAIPARWRLVPEGATLYEWQHECLNRWLKDGRGTVKVATGGGKTLFALAAAQALQNEREPDLRMVVVVPTIPLMFQWQDEARRGNLPLSAIGLMGGGQQPPSLSTVRILICVLNSARERLPDLVRRAGWSRRTLLVVDECHRAGAAQASRIFDAKPRFYDWAVGDAGTGSGDGRATE
ncbi:DEAD/DEAH box helicase family protein [Candidatus Amarolinea dominans]|uniref:DEAD/DEAH box helicase family protein n=1 Tax=Candidatus Amarolinea dominans TaxID=3140696 RepID=UPI0031CC41F6